MKAHHNDTCAQCTKCKALWNKFFLLNGKCTYCRKAEFRHHRS